MSFFVMRYISCLFLFMLGLKAPGIMSTDYQNLNNGTEDENRSTFRGSWQKMKTLLPFVWPKKDLLLQINVIVCFALLLAGRVINLYVPLYQKKIGKSRFPFI